VNVESLPKCQQCGEEVNFSTTLLASVAVKNGVATLYVDTDLLTDFESDAVRCGCDPAPMDPHAEPTLTTEDWSLLGAVLEHVRANVAPEIDWSLPDDLCACGAGGGDAHAESCEFAPAPDRCHFCGEVPLGEDDIVEEAGLVWCRAHAFAEPAAGK